MLLIIFNILLLFACSLNGQPVDYDDNRPHPQQRYQLGAFKEENPEYYYLPKTMTPTRYTIMMEPIFERNASFANVYIEGTNEESIDAIVLHALNLQLLVAFVRVNAGDRLTAKMSYEKKREFLTLKLDQTIPAHSNITVEIAYLNILDTTKKNRGFYIATYTDEFGVERRLATTHMEPTNAREVFPCFDEPALKAVFDITIIRPNSYNTKTNMPLKETLPYSGEKLKDVFHTTPLMSTYLVAIVVSEFETIVAKYPNQTVHQLHGDIADLRQNYGDLGLLSSRQVLSALEAYTGIDYSLPKIGQVAIPTGYFGGAMENWGLVIYGEESLLFKDGISTENHRQGVISIVSHEYAHQWFGNLVGPASWAYTWLNEGFAAFFTVRITSLVYPSWRYDDQFAWKSTYTMEYDARADTRPMTMAVGSPENIRSTFDVIAYDKAACVLRMFEHILGPRTFQNALNIYLNNRMYAAATADDLSHAFAAAMKDTDRTLADDIQAIFDTWHLQAGVPIVTVTRDYEFNTMKLTQQRFGAANNTDQLWSIPINYFLGGSTLEEKEDTKAAFWLNDAEMIVELPEAARDNYVVLNKKFTGYYRVNYDLENWNRIAAAGNELVDMNMNRVQLLNDGFTLLFRFELPLITFHNLLTSCVTDDDDYIVIKASLPYFDSLHEHLHATSMNETFKALMLQMYETAYNSYSNVERDGDYVQAMMRNEIVPRMCRIGHQGCLDEMHREMHNEHVLNSPNMQQSIVCAGLMNPTDGVEKLNMILDRINATTESEARTRLMNAATCTKNSEAGESLFLFIVYPYTNYLSWNTKALLQNYCVDFDNAKNALDFYLKYFNQLIESYFLADLKSFLMTICGRIYSPDRITQIEAFVEEHDLTNEFKDLFQEAANRIRSNIDRLANSPIHPDSYVQ